MTQGTDLTVFVDADACPRGARLVLERLQREFGFRLVTVSSFHHDLAPDDEETRGGHPAEDSGKVHHITVGDEPDAADWAIANGLRRGDIVVTHDWGLAALALGKGARAVSPRGNPYAPERMDFLLEERAMKAKVRRGGGRHKGPKRHTPADDQRLEHLLRSWLQPAKD